MEKKNGRKKHIVQGTVSEIKKTERSIGRSVGGRKSAFESVKEFLKGVFRK